LTILDRFNRHSFWKRVTAAGGRQFAVPTFDRWLYVRLHALQWMGGDVPRLARHIRPGMTVVDVGANIGYYTLVFAGLVGPRGRVLAFEPDPDLYAAAVENVRRNGKAEIVQLHRCALGAQTAVMHLLRGHVNSGDNRLRREVPHSPRAVAVPVKRLDDVIGGAAVDVIKIDVQGWECDVLEGMSGTLARHAASIKVYFEFWPRGIREAGRNPMDAVAMLRRAGCSLYRRGSEAPLSDAELEQFCRNAGRLTSLNLLAYRG